VLPLILSQISPEIRQQRHARKGEALKIHPGELMAPRAFKVKSPYSTQFFFGMLMFTAREDRTLELLTRGPTPNHYEQIYGEAPYYLADSSTTLAPNGGCSGLNQYAGPYYLVAMMSQGYPIGTPISGPSTGTSSSTSSGASIDWDSIEN
jgi:hypothetical protein